MSGNEAIGAMRAGNRRTISKIKAIRMPDRRALVAR